MEVFAVGFMVIVITAALTGVVAGALGGALAWRLRGDLLRGSLLTVCLWVLFLVLERAGDILWLRAKLSWGLPSLAVTFLVSSATARGLESRTALRPVWITLAAFGAGLGLGYAYLLSFRLGLRVPLLTALGASAVLLLLLWCMGRSRTARAV